MRQAERHLARHDAQDHLILAGDHLYRMDYSSMIDAHIDSGADISIAAQPVDIADASSMGIFRFDRSGQITGFEEKPNRERLEEIGRSIPTDRPSVGTQRTSRLSRRWASTSSPGHVLQVLHQNASKDFGREIIPAALGRYNVSPTFFAATGPTWGPFGRSTMRISC